MLRKVKDFENYTLRARDGDIGKAKEFYFEDEHWTVRYLVAETGSWLASRQVLISPKSLNPAIGYDDVIPVDLTKQQIQDSPSLANNQLISHTFDRSYQSHFGWGASGSTHLPWGTSPYFVRDGETRDATVSQQEDRDPTLHRTLELTGAGVQASDGDIGHIEDFIIDEETWTIRYLVVDTKNWWPGKHVLISPQWIDEISWDDSKISVKLTKDAIRQSPEYTPESLNRGYEEKLHAHYNSHGYWENQPGERASQKHQEALK